jgi:hypothetical protein
MVAVDAKTGEVFLGCDFLTGQFTERAVLSQIIFTAPKLIAL